MTSSQKPSVFIASSVEALPIARAIQAELRHDARLTIWNQGDLAEPGKYTLEFFAEAAGIYDYGIFVFAPDDTVLMRDQQHLVARDNVILELGFFIGALGRGRTAIIVPAHCPGLHLPSDLKGLGLLDFDAEHGTLQAAVGPACNKIRLVWAKLPSRSQPIEATTKDQSVESQSREEVAVTFSVEMSGAFNVRILNKGSLEVFITSVALCWRTPGPDPNSPIGRTMMSLPLLSPLHTHHYDLPVRKSVTFVLPELNELLLRQFAAAPESLSLEIHNHEGKMHTVSGERLTRTLSLLADVEKEKAKARSFERMMIHIFRHSQGSSYEDYVGSIEAQRTEHKIELGKFNSTEQYPFTASQERRLIDCLAANAVVGVIDDYAWRLD